jgi:hypothetical protein
MTMAIPARQRWVVYAIVLLLTLTAVKWAGGQDRAEPRASVAYQAERLERPAREAPAATGRAEAVPAVRLDQLEPRAAAAPAGDPFQARSWEPEQPAVRRNVPPPPPQAPPLPFAYMGKMVDGEKTTVFLTRLDRNYVVRPGDTLEGTYRVENVGEDALVLTYLPLGVEQALPFAAGQALPFAAARPPASAKAQKRAAADEDDDE